MRNVIILGMHRSGTSLVAGALASAGVYVGEPGDLLAEQLDNPRGFSERSDVVALDEAMLAASGGSWFRPPKSIAPNTEEFSSNIAAILSSLPSDRSFVIKDPRMVLTWPLWRDAVDDAVLLYVYRNPLSVAASLQRRHGFPLSLGLALWEYYNHFAISTLTGCDVLCVSYDSIANDPGKSLSALLTGLKELGVSCETTLSDAVFDLSLGHEVVTDHERGRELLSTSQRELAAYCEALCTRQALPALPALDEKLWSLIDDMSVALAPLASVLETRMALDDMSRLCDERTGERDKSLTQLRKVESEYAALAEVLTGEHRNQLRHIYGELLNFENSHLASIWRFAGRCYKLLTFRLGVRTGYENTVQDAQEFYRKHGFNTPRKRQGKLSLLGDVLLYVFENPAGSARSFSFQRLQRAATVFLKMNPEDLDTWIHSRFPSRTDDNNFFDPASLDAGLDRMRLVFPLADSPKVSIVVPVFNDYRVTKHCLKSILDNSGDVAYEVIIGDDCSSDLTASITDRVFNITVVSGEANRGFLGNCNDAAEVARGQYILFLNNDTSVCLNWLAPLLDVADADSSVGIVGPKLLFGNGKLQEAGGIVWNDGSAWNYGRGDSPDRPKYNYVKEVDYISGACLLVRADLWRQLGGFDKRYTPAYYEDTDIAFAARAAGYKVVYQPASRVIHYEGVSNGTDLGSGIKKYQSQNQKAFAEKWQQELEAFHFPNAKHVFQARDRSRNKRCVMFIDHYVPHYDKDAGSRSTFMYVELMLKMGYKVIFLGANYFPHKPYTQTLQQMGVEVLVGEHMARNQDRWLQENASNIDRIYLHRPHIAEQFLGSLEKMHPRPPIIFFGHDLHYLRISREEKVVGDHALGKSAEKWKKREYAVFDRVDKIYYPSQVEVDEITRQRPDLEVRAIPLYILDEANDVAYNYQFSVDIMFVGGFNHPPNVDGICWFVESVFPLVRRACPEVKLHIVGSNPCKEVQELQGESVIVYGYVSDDELDALYRRIRQVIVPLRFGAGVKGKVLEAIQKNVPLVTTTIGAEGIPDAQVVMNVADSARDFAAAVIQLDSGDPDLLAKLDHYQAWLRENFSSDNACKIIREDFGLPLRDMSTSEFSTAVTVESVQ